MADSNKARRKNERIAARGPIPLDRKDEDAGETLSPDEFDQLHR